MSVNNSCSSSCDNSHHGCNGFLIIIVLYILLAIILGTAFLC